MKLKTELTLNMNQLRSHGQKTGRGFITLSVGLCPLPFIEIDFSGEISGFYEGWTSYFKEIYMLSHRDANKLKCWPALL